MPLLNTVTVITALFSSLGTFGSTGSPPHRMRELLVQSQESLKIEVALMKKIVALFVFSLVLFANAEAQSEKDELGNIGKSLRQKISKEMPGWTYRSIQPMEGSQGVIIQYWEIGNIVAKVTVTEYPKRGQAESAFKEFKSRLRGQEEAMRARGRTVRLVKEELSTLGDEGFVSDARGSEKVAFRKGRFIVYISMPGPINNKDGFFSRKFAEHVAKALEVQDK